MTDDSPGVGSLVRPAYRRDPRGLGLVVARKEAGDNPTNEEASYDVIEVLWSQGNLEEHSLFYFHEGSILYHTVLLWDHTSGDPGDDTLE